MMYTSAGERWAAVPNVMDPRKMMLQCFECGAWFVEVSVGHAPGDVTMREMEFQFAQHVKTDHAAPLTAEKFDRAVDQIYRGE